jgi:hypothetical protein
MAERPRSCDPSCPSSQAQSVRLADDRPIDTAVVFGLDTARQVALTREVVGSSGASSAASRPSIDWEGLLPPGRRVMQCTH